MLKNESKMNRWFALESNPEVMNQYAEKLGLNTSKSAFFDVLSTEGTDFIYVMRSSDEILTILILLLQILEWALDMVPKPIFAVVMLFPINNKTEEIRLEEEQRIISTGQILSPNIYFMKQTVDNACGTVGIFHALGNARNEIEIREGSYLDKFFSRTCNMNPNVIADYFAHDDELEATHESAAVAGQSAPQQDDVDTHFICFSCVDGHLYELDGRKNFPINHGVSSQDTLLQDSCRVVRERFMAVNPEEMRFTILALANAA